MIFQKSVCVAFIFSPAFVISLHATRASNDLSQRIVFENVGAGGSSGVGAIQMQAAFTGMSQAVQSGGSTVIRSSAIGQLFEVKQLSLNATPNPAPEEASVELSALAVYGDGSSAMIPGAYLKWGIPESPLSEVILNASTLSANTEVHAVASDTTVVITGTYQVSASTPIQVRNTDPDNYPGYSGDSIDDGWQIEHGITTEDFIADSDADGDGIPLVLEAFMNLNPSLADSQGLPQPKIISENGDDYFALEFRKSKGTSLPFMVEHNPQLGGSEDWSPIGMVEATSSPVELDTATMLKTYRYTTPISEEKKGFLRLSVTPPDQP